MNSFTVEKSFHVRREGKGRKGIQSGVATEPTILAMGALPRITKLLALAHHFEALLRSGAIANQSLLASVGDVTRARVSQIMALLNLAPDIQDAILFLPRKHAGRDPIVLRDILPIAAAVSWKTQRQHWQQLVEQTYGTIPQE